MTRRAVRPPSIVTSVSDLRARVAREEKRLLPRDPSSIRNNDFVPTSEIAGSCLTATTTAQAFDPDELFGGGAITGYWTPPADINLTRLAVRVATEPDGDDLVVAVEASSAGTLATVTLSDGAESFDEWTGTAAVSAGDPLWFSLTCTVELEELVAQAWFDGAGGGGLIFWPIAGA